MGDPANTDFLTDEEYSAWRVEYFKKQDELSAEYKATMVEMSAMDAAKRKEAFELFKVENPITISPTIKRKFKTKDRANGVMRAIEDFAKMVSVPITRDDVSVEAAGNTRAHYSPGKYIIKIGPHDSNSTVIHELGHWLEDVSPDIHAKAVDFLLSRTEDDKASKLKKLTGLRYRSNEVACPDNFVNPYIGKIYQNVYGDIYATEVISMGLELMYSNPWKLLDGDPQMFDFIYNTVRGQ